MIWTMMDLCRNCNHSVHCHIGPYGRDGNMFGQFKIVVWSTCNLYGNMGEKVCTCTHFEPKDNLKYLEWKYEEILCK